MLAARALGFTARAAEASKTGADKLDNVFNLLDVDPLNGLKPAMREIARRGLFAERALLRDPTDANVVALAGEPTAERQRGEDAHGAASW